MGGDPVDARFHELAETADQGKGVRRRVGFWAWAILFLSVFAGGYCALRMVFGLAVSETVGKPIFQMLSLALFILGWGAGWPAIIHYRMRALLPIRCCAFFASISAIVLFAIPLYSDFLADPLTHDSFFKGVIVVSLVVHAVIAAEYSALRARCAYSEKTGDWLRCNLSKKGFVPDPKKPAPETVADVLLLKTAKKKWFRPPELALFQDSMQAGEHYLWFALPREKQKFFSLKFSRNRNKSVVIPLNWLQVLQLRAHIGDFKKTRFLPMCSISAGDAIRRLREGRNGASRSAMRERAG